jgi:hypothetical protein
MPRVGLPMKSQVGERKFTVEISGQRNNEKEAGQLEVGREEVNEVENRGEPRQLVGKADVRTAAIDACNPGAMIKEPIQNWIQRGGIEDSRGA